MNAYRTDHFGSEEEYEQIKRAGRRRLAVALLFALLILIALLVVLLTPAQEAAAPENVTVSQRGETVSEQAADLPAGHAAAQAAEPHFILSILPNPMTCRPSGCASESVPEPSAVAANEHNDTDTAAPPEIPLPATAVLPADDTPPPAAAETADHGDRQPEPPSVAAQTAAVLPAQPEETAVSAERVGQIRLRADVGSHRTEPIDNGATVQAAPSRPAADTATARPPETDNATICKRQPCRIQAGAYHDKNKAQEVQKALAGKGISVFIEETVHNGSTLHRVRTGRYSYETLQTYIGIIRELNYPVLLLAE